MQSNTEYKPEWIREDFFDFIAEKFDSIWAWKRIKAEISGVKALSPDFIQLRLRPNQNFKVQDYQAGQSILLTALIGGVRHQRSYSIVDISDQGQIAIAVKKQGAVSNALTALQAGDVVAVFPEGTTSDGRTLLPFYANLLQAPIDAHAAVQPVALQFFDQAGRISLSPCYIGDDTLLASIWRTLRAQGLVVRVTFGAAQLPAGRTRQQLAQAMQDAVGQMLAPPG